MNWASRDVSAPDQHKLSLTGYELLHVWKNEKDFEYGEGECKLRLSRDSTGVQKKSRDSTGVSKKNHVTVQLFQKK